MEYHVESDKELEGDDSDAENSEEELKRIEEELYFAIHYGEAEETGGEEASVTVYQDSPVKLWNGTPSPRPQTLPPPKDGPARLETSECKPKVTQTNDVSPKTNELLGTPKRKKQLKSAASSTASPVTPAVSVSSALDRQPSSHASKVQPDQGRGQEQKAQSAHVPASTKAGRPGTGQPETRDHVNVASPGMSIGALLKALQVSKHGAWSEDSDSSLDSRPVSQNSRPGAETAGTGRTPLKTTAKSSPVSDSTGRRKNSVMLKVCDAVKVDSDASPLGDKAESAAGAESSLSSLRESTKNVVDDEDAGDDDQLCAGLSTVKEMGKNAKQKKTSAVRTTGREESAESDTMQKGKAKSSSTLEQTSGSKSRKMQETNVRPVQSSGSSSSSGEESDSESSSSDESDSRLKKKHKTKKMLKPSSSTILKTKQKEKSVTAGRASEARKQTSNAKGSDVGKSSPAERPLKTESSSSDSESEPEKPKKTKVVSKVPQKVISCKTDSESDNSSSKEKKSKTALKKVQSTFSTAPNTKGQSKQTLKSLHPDVSVTVGSDSSMEESDTTMSSEDSDASSTSLDVNDSDFLNRLSDSSLKEDILYNMSAEDNRLINQGDNSQTVLSTPEPSKWRLNARDQAAAAGVRNSGSRSMRYFMPTRCDNCQEPGHLARDCPKPRKQVCHLCGRLGHGGHQCPERLCYNCDYPGHDARDCPRPRRSRHMICHRCQMGGHKQEDCPDQWRQYHATTSGVVPVKVKEKRNRNISCYNCGALGHLGYECEERRMNSYTLPNYPYVAWYDSAESIQRTIKAAKATKGNEEDNPWRRIRFIDPAGSKRKPEEEYETGSKRRKTSEDSSPQMSNRDDPRKEKTAESGKKTGSSKDSEKEAESGKRTEMGTDSKLGDGSRRDAPEAKVKRQNKDVALTSKKSAFTGPLEDFIPLGGGKKEERKPANHGGASRSGFNARPRTGHMARVRRWSESDGEESVPLFSTARNILRENRRMLREVTGDMTTHHLTGGRGQRPHGVIGQERHDSQSERQPVPTKLSRKRRREQESQVYGHHSNQWGEVDDAFHLIGADIGQLMKDTQDSHSEHGSIWDRLQDGKHGRNFHNPKHSNLHQNMWDLPSSSKRGRYDFPSTSQDLQADLDTKPAPKLNRKAQQRALERANKESKKALKEQRKLKKQQKKQEQEQRQRELEDEFGEDYDHQVFHNQWWLKDDASPPSPLLGGKQNKKKGKKKKKKSGNQHNSFEDDEGEDPFLTGIIQRQRKKGKKKPPSSLQDTRRKNPNLGVGPKTFRRNSPGPSHSGRKGFQKPSPHHHKQNQKHHNQKHEHHRHNQEHNKQNRGRGVSWNSFRRSRGFNKGNEGSSHFSHRVNSSFSPEDFPRNRSKGPQASFRGRGQGHGNRGFVSWGGFRVKKDILDRASNFFQNKGGKKNW